MVLKRDEYIASVRELEDTYSIKRTGETTTLHNLIADGKSVFVCGRAGVGKSAQLKLLTEALAGLCVILAPTGIAANNVGGQTIHSFFRFPLTALGEKDWWAAAFNPANERKIAIMRCMRVLVIDEVSMVRSDLFHAIDQTLRIVRKQPNKPFGGVQLVMFGDPYQLPPVVREADVGEFIKKQHGSPLFFCAEAFGEDFAMIELTRVFRQGNDEAYIENLNKVREGDVTPEVISFFNERIGKPDSDAVRLVTTRLAAQRINDEKLAQIPGEAVTFKATYQNMSEKDCIVDFVINMKIGARVMLCKNDPIERYYNGSLGNVTAIDFVEGVEVEWREHKQVVDTYVMRVALDDGREVRVVPAIWEKIEQTLRPDGKISKQPVGFVVQMPVRLAWAITVHKSQGLTLPKVHVDLSGGAFAPGQAYVALSRCTSLDGLTLERPLFASDVPIDRDTHWYRERFTRMEPAEEAC